MVIWSEYHSEELNINARAICFLLSREIKGLESHHGLQPFCFLLSMLDNKIICAGVQQ